MRIPLLLLLSVLPAAAQAERLPPPPGTADGPWAHRVVLAESKDGLSWNVTRLLADAASVPELFEDPDGRAIIIFVDGQNLRNAVLRETPDGRWERLETNLRGVDASVVALDGKFRAYVKAGLDGAMDAWESEDGVDWTWLRECFRDPKYRQATDPDVFQTPEGWVMLVSLGPRLLRCASEDGLSFEAKEELNFGGSVSDTLKVEGGWRTYFHVNGNPARAEKMHIRSAFTKDGVTWTVEEGVRLSAPAGGFASRGVGDPAPMLRRDGTWLMAAKSFMNPSGESGCAREADVQALRKQVADQERRLEKLERKIRELERK
jgi:hypothetical protein